MSHGSRLLVPCRFQGRRGDGIVGGRLALVVAVWRKHQFVVSCVGHNALGHSLGPTEDLMEALS